MSRLEELIRQLCPDGVKRTKLQNVCIFQNGFTFKSSLFKEQGKPILRIANISDGGIDEDSEYVFFEPDDYKEDLDRYRVLNGDIVVAMSGTTTGKIGYNYSDTTYYLNQRVGMFVVNEKLMVKRYLYHWLCMQSSNILNAASGSGAQPNLSSTKMMDFLIPLPPLEVQQEIVRILDQFTKLTAELTAELTARKKQYEYYRDKVFSAASSSGRTVLLGEVASFSQGIQIEPSKQYSEMKPGRIRFLRIVDFVTDNEPYRYIEEPDKKYIKTEDELIMIRYGASAAGRVFMCHTGAIANNMFKINLHGDILPRYLLHYLSQKSIYSMLNSTGGKSTMPAVNFKAVSKIMIPLVSLSEQKRIVDILDRFDTLCNDLTSGLPAEIEARQKQYEYYRDKLLTFKEKTS